MRRILPGLALTVLLAPVAAMGQPNPALWRFVNPNAKALIGIDWARIRPLQAGAMIREQWLTAGGLAAVPGLDRNRPANTVLLRSRNWQADRRAELQ
jgi:hypothetical protein